MTCICGLAMADMDVERLSTLLTCLPALVSIDGLDAYSGLTLRPHPLAALAAAQDSLAGAARAIGRCSGLRRLDLRIVLHDKLADRVSATLWQYLAEARALEHLKLEIRSSSVGANASHLITGLAGLSRLRTLALGLTLVCEKATLPACLSRLVQLTSLSLSGLRGLRCTPGWARLPALVCLEFNYCKFDPDGEEALPGLDALGSLTSLELRNCTGLHMLPISLWRLTQLRCLAHCLWDEPPRGELPVARPSACAPACMASLTHLSLTGYNLPTWPVCILAATRLAHLDLSSSCFEHLPEGVSVLTGLETLYLGRHSKGDMQIGGVLDARTLGNLACFPALRELSFAKCSALFGPSFQAAAAHPRLERLELNTSYPGCALSFFFIFFFFSPEPRARTWCACCAAPPAARPGSYSRPCSRPCAATAAQARRANKPRMLVQGTCSSVTQVAVAGTRAGSRRWYR